MSTNGIITKISQQDFQNTYQKLKNILTNNPNLKVLFELDHQANASSVDLSLPPTRIIFFGNPKLGTPLMQSGNLTGLDLPQKILVTERDGIVSVSYNDPSYLKERHSIEGKVEVIQKITGALDNISRMASEKE